MRDPAPEMTEKVGGGEGDKHTGKDTDHDHEQEQENLGQTKQSKMRGKQSSSLHKPTYPFDLTAAIALTDKLMEDLPPPALFKMADPDLQNMIIETK